jgi:cytidine deaminase
MNAPQVTPEDRDLLESARALSRRSIAPARDRAGAIALTRDGQRVPGVAVRVAGAPALSACAVPAALWAARAVSVDPVACIALWLPRTAVDQPCGLCLQIWRELAPASRFVVQREDDEPTVLALERLLPDPFTRFDRAT